jgi:hypothetical protein
MMRHALFAALLACTTATSFAADQTILGNQLLVKNPSSPEKRQVVTKAVEKASPNTIVGNPATSGATLTVTANGANPSVQTYSLPGGTAPSTGKPYWSGDAVKGFKYKDPKGDAGPVKSAQIKKAGNGTFQIKATISGKNDPVSVVPPNPGTDGCVLLTIAGGDSYSVKFASGQVTNKDGVQFKVSKPTAEGSCVTTTTTTTSSSTTTSTSSTTSTTINPTCLNGTIDPGEQCDTPGSACGGGGTCQFDCTCPCEQLDGADCMYPFPSDYLTVEDNTTDTGRRVHFSINATPKNNLNVPAAVADLNRNDGFSTGSTILLHVPGVDMAQTGAVPITDVERSFDTSQPVVLINTATLQRHLIWAELDANATSAATQAMIIHPAVSLDEGTRYIVALRNMKDASGTIIPPSAEFAAYRDDTPAANDALEARRPHMEDVFTTLASAGIARNDLYLAWDFTTASERNITERLLFARDDAFNRLGSAAPAFVVTNVENEVDSRIFRRVSGTFQVERYVDSTTPPAKFVLDANGLPTHQATTQPAAFQCIIPRAALANATATAIPARASIYGHGLLGSNTEVSAGNVRDMANEHNFVFCATKWIGMSDEDIGNAVGILQDISKFPSLTDRLQQSMVNQLFLARLMIHPNGFVANAAFQDQFGAPVIDTSDVFYDGNSQGGIFGGTVMAVAQDITRGVLGVPGMNYSLLLTRSTDFATYSAILYPSYPNELQRPLVLALIQMLWDRSDPNGYAHHMTTDPLPNTPQHKVLLHVAFGDHQVANVSTEIEARTIGASIHSPAITPGRHTDVNPYFGIPAIPAYPFDGSAIVIWDSGAAAPPITNTAPMTGADPHSHPRSNASARTQKSEFLKSNGAVVDVCGGAACVIVP